MFYVVTYCSFDKLGAKELNTIMMKSFKDPKQAKKYAEKLADDELRALTKKGYKDAYIYHTKTEYVTYKGSKDSDAVSSYEVYSVKKPE